MNLGLVSLPNECATDEESRNTQKYVSEREKTREYSVNLAERVEEQRLPAGVLPEKIRPRGREDETQVADSVDEILVYD